MRAWWEVHRDNSWVDVKQFSTGQRSQILESERCGSEVGTALSQGRAGVYVAAREGCLSAEWRDSRAQIPMRNDLAGCLAWRMFYSLDSLILQIRQRIRTRTCYREISSFCLAKCVARCAILTSSHSVGVNAKRNLLLDVVSPLPGHSASLDSIPRGYC